MALAFAACSKSSNSISPASPSASDTTVSFSAGVQPIFTKNCALSGCHAGANPPHGENLSAGMAYSNIVDVRSEEEPRFFRVKPFSPDSSYLYLKITGNPLIFGVRMPYYKMPLSQTDIQTIQRWIEQGAKND